MAQFVYEVEPHGGGWVILLAPADDNVFATQQAAFDAASELSRRLRFTDHSLSVRMPSQQAGIDKAS